MIGKKMALRQISSGLGQHEKTTIPKSSEENHHDDGKDTNADGFGFLEALNQAIQECSNPEKPLEQSSQHTATDDGYVYNLQAVSFVLQCTIVFSALTSLAGQGSEMSITPFSSAARANMPTCSHAMFFFVRGSRRSGDAIQEVLTQVGHRGGRADGGSRRAQE